MKHIDWVKNNPFLKNKMIVRGRGFKNFIINLYYKVPVNERNDLIISLINEHGFYSTRWVDYWHHSIDNNIDINYIFSKINVNKKTYLFIKEMKRLKYSISKEIEIKFARYILNDSSYNHQPNIIIY